MPPVMKSESKAHAHAHALLGRGERRDSFLDGVLVILRPRPIQS
jgi:hypothetical protein